MGLEFYLVGNNHLAAMRHSPLAPVWALVFALIFCAGSTFAQGTIDVSQSNISGSEFSSQLGNPFGQTFRPTIAGQLGGVVVGIVNVNTPAPLSLSLFLTDASGALIGNPLASGSLSAQEGACLRYHSGRHTCYRLHPV